MIGCFVSMIGSCILTYVNPVIGIFIFGIGYTMRVSVMFVLLNELVPKESFGKAYGILRSFKDLMCSIVFVLVSILVHY
jgi:MFS family permease